MFSRIVFFIVALVMCYTSFVFYPRWKQPNQQKTISWDVSGYYWYLPSIFIYKDLRHQSFKNNIVSKYTPASTDFQQAVQSENGNYVMKYSSGMAVMYFPFFIVAHLLARPLGFPADGFSPPYQVAIQFGGLLVALIGLWYLRKLLLVFYEDRVVAIALLLLVLGTNYLDYSAIECGMSHSWLFTVYVFLLLNTHYYYQSFRRKYAVRIGLLIGLAVLVRPADIVSVLIPMLWGLERVSLTSLKERLLLFAKKYGDLLLAAGCAFAVVFIQLAYWKYASGHWLYYSYQGQKLYFKSPNFVDYTFSYRSGWLTYSPLLILAFIGIIPFARHGQNKVAIITFFLLNYYVVCCWNIWWYGGRAMIQSYPVLFFPVAALIQACLGHKVRMLFLSAASVVFIYYNIWLTYQEHNDGLFFIDSMKKEYFWRVVGRWGDQGKNATLLIDNTEQYDGALKDQRLIYQNDFAGDTGVIFAPHQHDNAKSMVLDFEHQNSGIYKAPLTAGANKWIRAEALFHCEDKEWDQWKMAQFVLRAMYHGEKVKENMVRVHRVLSDGEIARVDVDMKLPGTDVDSLNIFFWNGASRQAIRVDSLKVWSFSK